MTYVRRLGYRPTAAERKEASRRRNRLQDQIDDFQKKAVEFWGPPAELEDHFWEDVSSEGGGPSDSDDDEKNIFLTESPLDIAGAPERRRLLLPSTLGINICNDLGYTCFAEQELALRIGQANDALQGLRLCLSKKAVIFRQGLRSAKSKVKKTRSWHEIGEVDGGARHLARRYSRTRIAMIRLGASSEQLERYQLLKREHLGITTAQIDPSQRGQRNTSLAWFWTIDVKTDTEAFEGMAECKLILTARLYILIWVKVYRVHWLKAKARRDRWKEEYTLLQNEMDWTVLFFRTMQRIWLSRANAGTVDAASSLAAGPLPAGNEMNQGLISYAHKQASMWSKLADHASVQFSASKMRLESEMTIGDR